MRKVMLVSILLIAACTTTPTPAPPATPPAPGAQPASAALPTASASGGPVTTAQETRGMPDERADQLIRQLTLAEKFQLLSGGAGGFTTHPIERLGIPGFTMSDGPVGVRNGPGRPTPPACAFPAGAALAATFDAGLATAYGQAVGLEGRARGTQFQLGPGLNICRVPVNGRNFEYFGEDPYLASVMAAHWARACSAQGVVPTLKHFAANNQEDNRNSVDARVDERTMHEIYLPAFKKASTEGGIVAVMCSYNRLNGSYASNNDWLLNQTLKQSWGFKGLVMSDWGASHSVTDVAKGLDLEMPSGSNLNPAKLNAALADGSVKPAEIDGAVHRLLRTAAAQGWLDATWKSRDESLPMDSPESLKVALQVAQDSIVLLKNQGDLLPLDRARIRTIVVVGPNATAGSAGGMPANIGGGGSSAVTPYPDHFADADYLLGITRVAGDGVKVIHLPMPTGPINYDEFGLARTKPDGEQGFNCTVEVSGEPAVPAATSIQKNINLTWQTGQLPLDAPAGRDATYTWTGVLAPPQDGDWELHITGAPVVTIAGRSITNGTILHLSKDYPAPITVKLEAKANPPSGGRGGRRGGRGGGGGSPMVRVTLTPPAIPDLAQARSADAVIVCVGLNRNVESEGRDRPFELPAIQQYLITAVTAANPHTVVVTNAGAAVGMDGWVDRPAAILHAWYLGQEGGIALGEVLFGDVNPSGRLCSTWDRRFEDNPAYAHYPGKVEGGVTYPTEHYAEGIFYGYRGYDQAGKNPLFPFGFGLSYTQFALSNMTVARSGNGVEVSLDVRNTGTRAGAEVVQIYVGEQGCLIPRPLRELKSFAKVPLAAGQTRSVAIYLPHEAFAYWSPDKRDWVVDSGNRFTIEAATSERDIRQKATVATP